MQTLDDLLSVYEVAGPGAGDPFLDHGTAQLIRRCQDRNDQERRGSAASPAANEKPEPEPDQQDANREQLVVVCKNGPERVADRRAEGLVQEQEERTVQREEELGHRVILLWKYLATATTTMTSSRPVTT
jgi:hypothetical protein